MFKAQNNKEMMIFASNSALILCIILVMGAGMITGCEGPAGPQGDQGPQGLQGIAGSDGNEGPQGDPGAANVIYSNWIPFNTSNWVLADEFGRQTQLYKIDENRITSDIIDKGLVMVYVKFGGASSPRPLPFTGYILSLSKEQHLWYRLETDAITIVFHNLNDNLDPGRFGSTNQYRYIIIPGGTPAKIKDVPINYKEMSYKELTALFKITE